MMGPANRLGIHSRQGKAHRTECPAGAPKPAGAEPQDSIVCDHTAGHEAQNPGIILDLCEERSSPLRNLAQVSTATSLSSVFVFLLTGEKTPVHPIAI